MHNKDDMSFNDSHMDEREEYLMREDDDFWADRIYTIARNDTFETTVKTLKALCNMYDRDYEWELAHIVEYFS